MTTPRQCGEELQFLHVVQRLWQTYCQQMVSTYTYTHTSHTHHHTHTHTNSVHTHLQCHLNSSAALLPSPPSLTAPHPEHIPVPGPHLCDADHWSAPHMVSTQPAQICLIMSKFIKFLQILPEICLKLPRHCAKSVQILSRVVKILPAVLALVCFCCGCVLWLF